VESLTSQPPYNKKVALGFKQHRTVEATVTRACVYCGAPGVYQGPDRQDVREKWPECFTIDSCLIGKSVGGVCPCCAARRPNPEDLGVIQEQWVFANKFEELMYRFRKFFGLSQPWMKRARQASTASTASTTSTASTASTASRQDSAESINRQTDKQ
jgi:hypothetical protein